MSVEYKSVRPRLMVLTSTYPRWKGDPEPGFVHELSTRLAEYFDVLVLAPHAKGAMFDEDMDGVKLHRYRYAPAAWETLVNDGGIVNNLKREPWKWLLVPMFMLAQLFSTWRLIRRWRPDVVHAHWLIPQGIIVTLAGRLGRHRPPVVVTSHGADLYALRGAVPVLLKKFVLHHAAALTVVSANMQEEIRKLGADSKKVSVQSMGVDMQSKFTPDPAIIRSNSELLFVGRLVEKKGLKYLLEAMPDVLSVCPDSTLTVVGFGPEEQALRSRAEQLGLSNKISFVGAVAHDVLPAMYRRAALFVAPFVQAASGDQEGLGLVAVEAAACGCPVLVGDVPATRDLPFDRVKVTDPANLARTIVGILKEPTKAVAAAHAAQQACRSRFDWNVVVASYAEMFGKLVGNREVGRYRP